MLTGGGCSELRAAAQHLLAALDIEPDGQLDFTGMAGQAAAPVLQAAGVLRGDGQSWANQSDEALSA
jgi:hypothetical protein